MSRVFWMAVGAVGGVVAYRKGARALEQAHELGALGTARAAASATSRVAGRTAHGLRRLEDVRDRRAGRLVIGSVEDDSPSGYPDVTGVPPASVPSVPAGWVPADQAGSAPSGAAGRGGAAAGAGHAAGAGVRPSAPSVVILSEGDSGAVDDEPVRPQSGWTAGSAGSATARTTRSRRG
jgi:hypothetical protein